MKDIRRTAIVTGGDRGIGEAIVRSFSHTRMNLVIGYFRNIEAATRVAEEIKKKGCGVITVQGDVADETQAENLVKKTISTFGRVDILVNNAGLLTAKAPAGISVSEMTKEEWDRVLDVNLTGVFNCSKTVLPLMLKQRWGRIINISSMGGKTGNCPAHYTASKAGVIGFTKTLAREVAAYGITVNTVTPGLIETDLFRSVSAEEKETKIRQIPLGRLGTAKDVAEVVSFLASEKASYITGATIDTNGGMLMD